MKQSWGSEKRRILHFVNKPPPFLHEKDVSFLLLFLLKITGNAIIYKQTTYFSISISECYWQNENSK